jgi:hypothetical protein
LKSRGVLRYLKSIKYIVLHCIDDTNENKKIGIFGLFDLNWGGDDDT